MIIKKLFFATSIAFMTITPTLPSEESEPQEQQSTTQSIKNRVANFVLLMSIGLQTTYLYGAHYIDYIKSYFWPNTPDASSNLIQNTIPTESSTTLQVATKPLGNMIPAVKPQDVEQKLVIVKQDLAALQSSSGKSSLQQGQPEKQNKPSSLIEALKNKTKPKQIKEIDSPAVQQDNAANTNKQLTQLVQHVKELDMAIAQLPTTEWPLWQAKQKALLDPVAPALKNIIQENIKNSWNAHGTEILKLAIQATNMGVTGALGVFAAQYAKMATGNLEAIDTDALLLTFLTYASAALIEKTNTLLTGNKAVQYTIASGETNILFQAILAPSIKNKTYQFKMPLFKGVIDYMIMNEAYAVMSTMLEQNGEIQQTIKNINLKEILLGKKSAPSNNMFVTLALPKVKAVVNNQKFALALAEVSWIFFQSATLGGLFWAAGLGYANTTFTESVSNAVLMGMAQGIVANVAAITNNTTPGALVSVSTIPLSQQMLASSGVNIATTPQTVITGVLQAVATEATNFIGNEAGKSGGFFEAIQKGKEALGAAVSSRWASSWASITDAWENMQDIEPIPL